MENPTAENQSTTTPPSPSHSPSSSSEFEFAVSPADPCPAVADELFYKGLILPLPLTLPHTVSVSVSVMRSFLVLYNQSSSSSSSSAAESFSSDLPAGVDSSLADSDDSSSLDGGHNNPLSLSGFWSDSTNDRARPDPSGSTKLKAVARRCLTKMKPFCEKLRQRTKPADKTASSSCFPNTAPFWPKKALAVGGPRQEGFKARVSCAPSCPSLIRSNPARAGASRVPRKPGFAGQVSSDSSTVEEVQSAIQGAIAHCKNSLR